MISVTLPWFVWLFAALVLIGAGWSSAFYVMWREGQKS